MALEDYRIDSFSELYTRVEDPLTGWKADISIGHGTLGKGAFKQIRGYGYVATLRDRRRILLGSAGIPVIASARRDNPDISHFITSDAIKTEDQWLEEIEYYLDNERVILRKLGNTAQRDSLILESMPFAHSLGDAFAIIAFTPDTILPPAVKRFKMLEYLVKSTLLLEKIHRMGYTHGDAGAWHLDNFLLSAQTDQYAMIDLSHVQIQGLFHQESEMIQYSRMVLDYAKSFDPERKLHILPQEIYDALAEGRIPNLNSKTLALYGKSALRTVMGNYSSVTQALQDMNQSYFQAYLYHQVHSQTNESLKKSTLRAIIRGIENQTIENPTIELPAIPRMG